MRLGIHLIAALLMTGIAHANVPFWGDKASMPVETDPATLKPGQFVWDAAASPAGPIVVVVSLAEQRADVYRNGIRIGVTTVSTGRPGHETPTGVFTILQKDKDHHSTIYNNAAMPYTERLTWGGIALHAGGLPGHPSSHGCVHLPSAFARDLFEISPMGMTVVVANTGTAPSNVVHPAAIAPVDPDKGAAIELEQLSQEDFLWQPDKSRKDRCRFWSALPTGGYWCFEMASRLVRHKSESTTLTEPLGTHVFVLLKVEPKTTESSASDLRWIAVGVPGHTGEDKKPLDPGQAARVHLPASFRDSIHKALHPGVSMMVTDAPVLESTTGVPLTVVTADPQTPAGK